MIEMDITRYTGYFHDGSIFAIWHEGNNMRLSISSAEVFDEDLIEDLRTPVPLSNNGRIKGILHISNISKITISDVILEGKFTTPYDSAGIFDLEIEPNSVKIDIVWDNYRPKPDTNDFWHVVIEAESICWELNPSLVRPHSLHC